MPYSARPQQLHTMIISMNTKLIFYDKEDKQMLYCLALIGIFCLFCGIVYPVIMAVVWLLFYRNKQGFIEFMNDC